MLPALWLNEIQSKNQSTVMYNGGFPDWIELYNADPDPVDLGRITIEDASGAQWSGDGELAAGERLMLWDDLLPFSLNADGDTLTLSIDGTATDRISLGVLEGDTAWARFPDGGTWAITARPTPGQPNGSAPPDSIDPSDTLFQIDQPNDLWIQLSDDAFSSLTDDGDAEVSGSIGYKQAWFAAVGVRRKGGLGSARDMDEKTGLKIDLNAFEDHRIRGVETLTINSMVQDPTYAAEHLAYTVFRAAGIPAPRVGYARLYVNNEFWGLYSLIETVDDTFLRRWYADGSGRMYEGAYGADFSSSSSLEYDEGPEPDDRSDVDAVAALLSVQATDAAISALEQRVDLDEFIYNQAIESAILHWDGYADSNNYRLYHDPVTDRFQILPWGTDQTFVDQGQDPWDVQGEVLEFCFQNDACDARYCDALLDAADLIESLALDEQLIEITQWLADDIEIDLETRAETSAAEHEEFVSTALDTIAQRPDELRSLVEEHLLAR